MIWPCTVHIRQLLLLAVQFPQHWKILLVPSRSEVARSMFPKRLPWSSPHAPEHAKVSQRLCGFCCRMSKLNLFRKLVVWGLSLMTSFPGHLTWTQSASRSQKLVLNVIRTGNWPPRQEGNFSSQLFSQIWIVLLKQPSRSCWPASKIDLWRFGETPFDAWQVLSRKIKSYHWSEV